MRAARVTSIALPVIFSVLATVGGMQVQSCDHTCLEKFADEYRAAYILPDPSKAPISPHVVFTENNVGMKFPDASWLAVTKETGPALTFSDPVTGNVGV